MQYYLAPMEGITGYVYRNAYHAYFYPMDKYFTPFLSPGQEGELRNRDVQEILPENNPGIRLIPQILTNRAEAFLGAAELLETYGYREVNLNLGCPSGTVTAKGKGAGFLRYPDALDRFLEEISRGMEGLGIKFSIKTRVGGRDPEEFPGLLEIYGRYPLTELIIHPRVQKDFYKNTPRMESFALGMERSRCPVCYNGDITCAADIEALRDRFPDLGRVMIGRGILADPFLLERVYGDGILENRKERLREFHQRVYEEYLRIMSGDRNVLFKMKELWSHLIKSFRDGERFMKKIGKAKSRGEYEAAVAAVFHDLDLK